VPQQAVQRTTDGATVLVVGADNKVTARPIKTETSQGNLAIVSAGLNPGDRVIVEGLQKAKPGSTVKTVAWVAPAAPDAAAPATAAAPAAPAPSAAPATAAVAAPAAQSKTN
jgi:membrane fusion protein (multidrug efflux system)